MMVDVKDTDDAQNTDDKPVETNTPEEQTETEKKGSNAKVIITFLFFIIIAGSAGAYHYNLGGVKKEINHYYTQLFPKTSTSGDNLPCNDELCEDTSSTLADNSDQAEKTMTTPVKEDEIENSSASDDQSDPQEIETDQDDNINTQSNTETDIESDVNKADKPLSFIGKIKHSLTATVPSKPDPIANNQAEQSVSDKNQKIIKILSQKVAEQAVTLQRVRKSVQETSQQVIDLNHKIHNGLPYLDEFIELKSQLRTQKVDLPTLTEYASGGFPTDVIIVTDYIEVLKNLALIENRKESDDIFNNILSKFVVVTPKNSQGGFSGKLKKIYKALTSSHFDLIPDLIDNLEPSQAKELESLKTLILDKELLQSELKLLNDVLVQDIFASHLKN